jgi:hypothetical protein
MAVDPVVAHTESEPGPDHPVLEAQGDTALERWLLDHTALVGEIKVAQARVAQQAAYALHRHLAGLRHAPLPRAYGPAAPARTDHAVRAAVLGLTIRRSFAAS